MTHTTLPTKKIAALERRGEEEKTGHETGMSGNHFLHFGTWTGKPKKLSRCSGREREIQKTIPVVRDGNGKYKKSFP